MLQADEPDDFVIATGETHSVREFLEIAFARAGPRVGAARRDRPALLPSLRGRRAARRRVEGEGAPRLGGRPWDSRSSSRLMVDADCRGARSAARGQGHALQSREHVSRPSPDFWRDKNVVVTGGSGFVGRTVVEMLDDLGARTSVPASARARPARSGRGARGGRGCRRGDPPRREGRRHRLQLAQPGAARVRQPDDGLQHLRAGAPRGRRQARRGVLGVRLPEVRCRCRSPRTTSGTATRRSPTRRTGSPSAC